MVLHQAVDADTAKFMSAKDINTDDYTAMKRYIETRLLEELGCRPVNVEKRASTESTRARRKSPGRMSGTNGADGQEAHQH